MLLFIVVVFFFLVIVFDWKILMKTAEKQAKIIYFIIMSFCLILMILTALNVNIPPLGNFIMKTIDIFIHVKQ